MTKLSSTSFIFASIFAIAACGGGGGTGTTSTSTTGQGGGSTTTTSAGGGDTGGGATTASAGGSGGGTTPGGLGDPCTDDAACDEGLCILEDGQGWPGGFCTGLCNLDVPTCQGTGTCLDVNDPSGGYCFQVCTMGGNECGAAYKCTDAFEDGTTFICLPGCTTDAQCPTVGSCDPAQGLCIKPEGDCGNFEDDDDDDLIDCEDPSACQGTPACASGNTPTGKPCAKASDCKATGGDPACLDEPGFGWPKGYCSEFCDLATNDCGSPSSVCIDANLPSGSGLCLFQCAVDADCTTPGYICNDFGSTKVCMPKCTADNQCATFCNTDNGLCSADDENCSDGMDNDGDDLTDCEDLDCAAACGPQITMACMSPPVAMASTPGNTTGGTNLFSSSCNGSGSLERVYLLTPGAIGQVGVLDLTLESATDQGIYVRTTCADPATEIACTDAVEGGTNETLSIPVTGGVPLIVFVDGYIPGEEGAFTLTSMFTQAICGDNKITLPEECDGGNVTPGDGCDATCHVELAFYCQAATPAMLGMNPGDTTNGTNFFKGSCDGDGANEKLFSFTPAMDGMLHVVLKSDTDQGVYIRTACADAASQVVCVDDAFMGADEVFDVAVKSGVPLTFIVDGYAPGQEGPFSLNLSFL